MFYHFSKEKVKIRKNKVEIVNIFVSTWKLLTLVFLAVLCLCFAITNWYLLCVGLVQNSNTWIDRDVLLLWWLLFSL